MTRICSFCTADHFVLNRDFLILQQLKGGKRCFIIGTIRISFSLKEKTCSEMSRYIKEAFRNRLWKNDLDENHSQCSTKRSSELRGATYKRAGTVQKCQILNWLFVRHRDPWSCWLFCKNDKVLPLTLADSYTKVLASIIFMDWNSSCCPSRQSKMLFTNGKSKYYTKVNTSYELYLSVM